MRKYVSLTILALCCAFASFATNVITGPLSTCLGTPSGLSDTLGTGGTWTSSNPAVATIGYTTGYVYGVSAGTTTITYTDVSGYITATYTVNPAPPLPITGGGVSVCIGATVALSDPTPGGTWSSSAPYAATVNPVTGLVTAVSGGGTTIYYSLGSPCMANTTVYIITTNPGTITGPSIVCAGSSVYETDSASSGSPSSGVWSSSNTAIATVAAATGSACYVYGVSAGSVTITFTVAGTCSTAYTTRTITVSNVTPVATISGASSVHLTATTTLGASISFGTWSSSNTSVATIGPTGTVTGVTVGSCVITYNYTGCGGAAFVTYPMAVTPINGVSGHVIFDSGYSGNVKVWLITYNSATLDLEALDSGSYSISGDSLYYEFLTVPTDSYRVKAAITDTDLFSTPVYIPTYDSSSFYWYSANVIPHISGTADINQNIFMAHGAITSGPGFIAGNVTTGANKGTSGSVPVSKLAMVLLNSATHHIIQSTRTDASGNYSFSSLPLGTYYIFPDSLNYRTTAYTGVTLTSASPSKIFCGFTQHTLSKTIIPNNLSVNNNITTNSVLFIFPNPTNGKLNLQWNESATENGHLFITDVTGREVYKTVISMPQGTGVKQIDLSGFANGLYLITVKSATINYNSKIQIQH